jgi:DNA adenine methylase
MYSTQLSGRHDEVFLKPPMPFLRWAGGKRKLVPIITSILPESYDGKKNRYFEPFLGGGSLMFALGHAERTFYTPGKNIFINDLNPDLVTTYQVIRDEVENLITELSEIGEIKTKDQFERVKKWKPESLCSQAARFIYLNKTCFNGLWRVNGKGEFNVPWGKIKNPLICDSENLRTISNRLQKSQITHQSYASALSPAGSGDLVYLDPPYIPLSASSSFSKYSKQDFGILEHYALSGVIEGLTERGAIVILSNSDTPQSREIFSKSMYLYKLNVSRSIAANSSSRKKVSELIATNFKLHKSKLTLGLSEV